MRKLLLQIITGILALYLSILILPGVYIENGTAKEIEVILLAGLVLGLANHFLKPIINLITFPLKILTLGLFALVVNMLLVWLVDILFPSLVIIGLWPLFWTGFLLLVLNILIVKVGKKL